MQMLKINGCTDNKMWYSRKIGKSVPFLGYTPEGFKSREDKSDGGYSNIVRYEDASVVNV